MSAETLLICDALADSLAAATFDAGPVSVERQNWPGYSVEDLLVTRLAVTPGGIETTRVNRTQWQYDHAVNVFLGGRAATDAAADSLLNLCDEVLDAIRRHDWAEAVEWPAGVTSPVSVTVTINPDDGLADRNVWRAVAIVTYRTFRE